MVRNQAYAVLDRYWPLLKPSFAPIVLLANWWRSRSWLAKLIRLQFRKHRCLKTVSFQKLDLNTASGGVNDVSLDRCVVEDSTCLLPSARCRDGTGYVIKLVVQNCYLVMQLLTNFCRYLAIERTSEVESTDPGLWLAAEKGFRMWWALHSDRAMVLIQTVHNLCFHDPAQTARNGLSVWTMRRAKKMRNWPARTCSVKRWNWNSTCEKRYPCTHELGRMNFSTRARSASIESQRPQSVSLRSAICSWFILSLPKACVNTPSDHQINHNFGHHFQDCGLETFRQFRVQFSCKKHGQHDWALLNCIIIGKNATAGFQSFLCCCWAYPHLYSTADHHFGQRDSYCS